MIDIHSHIIPAIDDGSKDLEMSLQMIKEAKERGTSTIVATPHFYAGYFENNYASILEKVNDLKEQVKKADIHIEICPGQEVMVDRHLSERYESGILGTINQGRYMLLEFPMDILPKDALENVYELKILGVRPIIAHPERYMYIMKNPEEINKFIDEDYLFQLNTGSLEGKFGKQVQKTAEILVRNGLCDFLASDAHSLGHRSTGIKNGLEILNHIDSSLVKSIKENSQAVIKNQEIHIKRQKLKEKKTLFSFLRKK